MDILKVNEELILRRLETGINLLKEHYELKEVPVDSMFATIQINGLVFNIKQYEVVGVGNLLLMSSTNSEYMQMDTFVLTPYYKELPLFTTDYMYVKEKRNLLNEIYNLVSEKYIDEEYKRFIEEFKNNCDKYRDIAPMKVKPCWYDDIRPVCIALSAKEEESERTIELFVDNLKTFIKMEKARPLITDKKESEDKWLQNWNYANRLIDEGGVSTDVFKASFSEENTRKFFNSVFFGPEKFKQ